MGTEPKSEALATSEKTGRADARLRREFAYIRIREMVLRGDFAFGQRLGEEAIAEAVGVSRTPVREALARLYADKLLRRYSDGGFYVAEPDLLDLRDLYELRLSLETGAILRGGRFGIEHDWMALNALRDEWLAIQANPPVPDGSFIELDEAFHVALCRASGNLAYVETLESINVRIRTIRMYDFLTPDRIDISAIEHLEILDAVLNRRYEEGARLMGKHIGDSLSVVETRAADAMARMLSGRSRRRDASHGKRD